MINLPLIIAPAPNRQYSCMSFQENDSSQHDDDYEQENSEGISAEQQQLQLLETNTTPGEPHQRSCTEGYTFCFSLWNQTANGTRFVKQGKDNGLSFFLNSEQLLKSITISRIVCKFSS